MREREREGIHQLIPFHPVDDKKGREKEKGLLT